MNGLAIWEHEGKRIIRADYSLVDDPMILAAAVMKLQEESPTETIYALIDFAFIHLSPEFLQFYKNKAVALSSTRTIVAAYLGLVQDMYAEARKIIKVLPPRTTYVEFFETESAAISWLLSFDRRVEDRRNIEVPVPTNKRTKKRRKN